MVHPEWEDEFGELFFWTDQQKKGEAFGRIVDTLRKEGRNEDGDVISSVSLGCAYFIDHSDCDGCFNEIQCKHIANALRALLETDIPYPDDRKVLTAMAEIFEMGSQNDHGVEIL